MSDIRVDIEAFIAGDLDYGELQRRLSESFSRGGSPARARKVLESLRDSGGVPQGLYNVLGRAIERYRESPEEVTDPFVEDTVEEPPATPLEEYPIDLDEALLPSVYTEDREPAKKEAPPPEIRLHPEQEAPGHGPGAGPGAPAEGGTGAAAGAGAAAGRAAAPRRGLPEPGEALAERYELGEITGRGGMGVVFRALDRRRQEAGSRETGVAVKVLRPELQGKPVAESRLMAEALRGQALRHRNLVRVYDVGRDGDRVFVAMELLEGESLRNRIIRGGPEGMDRREGRVILAGLLEAVAYMHEEGFVHGDLKPGNVFLTRDGEPKLLDFGLTRRSDRESEPVLEAAVPTPGRTPAYSSPERLAGRPTDRRDDVFALGCIAYEVLSGKHPYGKKPADQARQAKMRPAPVRGLSPRQWRTLLRALDFNGRRRPRDAGRLLEGLGFRPTGSGRPSMRGLLPGLLAGLAAGVLLALALIHPGGPIGRVLTPSTPAPGGRPEPAPPADVPAAPDRRVIGDGPPADDADTRAAGEGAPADGEVGTLPDGAVFRPPGAGDPEPTEPAADAAPDAAPIQPAPPQGPGRIGFARSSFRVSEGQAAAILPLVRSEGAGGRVSLRWRTEADSAGDGQDFVGSDWRGLAFADGQTAAQIFVPLVNDGVREPLESFFVEIADPAGGAELAGIRRVRIEISDDD